jgi:hypothetical protein
MKWSITKSKTFSHCQRKWYYSEIVASPTSKDPIRREAYLLKQCKSLQAWRGSIVDQVIEKFVVPQIKIKRKPSEVEVMNICDAIMNKQLAFGKEALHRKLGVSKSKNPENYCAFYDVEYGGSLQEDKVQEAKKEARAALRNLLQDELLDDIMRQNSYIVAQRQLSFKLNSFSVSCTPDLIVFNDGAPEIIDWKVHSFGNADSWLQLGVYAVALTNAKPHKDFPLTLQTKTQKATDIKLLEFQLLKNKKRQHFVTEEDEADIYDYIFKSCLDIEKVVGVGNYETLDINQFQTARSPRFCQNCQFKKLCWSQTKLPKFQQMLFGDE